jgi:hypothetical protein
MTVSLTTRNELDADGTGDEVPSAPALRGTDRRRDRVIQAVNSRPGVELSALPRWSAAVGSTLRRLLPARFAGSVRPARSEVGGVAWLALAVLDPALATRDAHARLCA